MRARGLKKLFLRTFGKVIPSDVFAYRMPVSLKGICLIDNRVILLKNEHGQWDVPGGKLRKTEPLEACLRREFREEVGIEVKVERLLGARNWIVRDKVNVLVLVYQCSTAAAPEEMRVSEESFDLRSFSLPELRGLPLAGDYLPLIRRLLMP